MDTNELLHALRALANRWALKAREFARDGRDSGDAGQAQYYRGFAEGYYKAATELAAVLKGEAVEHDSQPVTPRATGQTGAVASNAPRATGNIADAQAVSYVALTVGEVLNILEFAGTSPRDVQPRPGNTYVAVFSRWENLTPPERIAKIASADPRLVILGSGKLKDTNDPFVEIAFKQG